MNKVELLQEHAATWGTNGLRDLTYEILSERNIYAEVIHISNSVFTYVFIRSIYTHHHTCMRILL